MIMNSYAIRAGSMFDGISMSGPSTIHVTDGKIVSVDDTSAPLTGGGDVIDLRLADVPPATPTRSSNSTT
jgi:N-acyl-D-aspartate/D-glutamate deacylase